MKKKTRRKKWILSAIAAVVVILLVWSLWGNTALELNHTTVKSERLPKGFDGYRIAHVSDLHNAEFGENNEKLLTLIAAAEPDMIAITGDLVDSRRTDIDVALDFAREAVEIAPCYYVPGNHEARIPDFEKLENGLKETGVTTFRNGDIPLKKDGAEVRLVFLDDPAFHDVSDSGGYLSYAWDQIMEETWFFMGKPEFTTPQSPAATAPLTQGSLPYTIVLSHRPEAFDAYCEMGADLVLTGHAHGGQFRLPGIGGLVAPGQGLFPEYDAGLYTEGHTNMVVSRGLGNSLFPLRFNNRPEVVLVELKGPVW
ncbi:MAG: metallophosphoesterase [Firmicutes bacterium]|nr:metallophosphoesterase [Bacillota bacterium]